MLLLAREAVAQEPGYDLPSRVSVLPVVFVPKKEAPPSALDQELFLRHLGWSRERFGQLLGGDSFELAAGDLALVHGREDLKFYRARPENGAPEIVAELLEHVQFTRFSNPYVFCVLVANPDDDFPAGGGRTINGGLNSGGGIVLIASSQLHRNRHFQTTLQHELGHGFGLPHPDVYGYDLRDNPSIMSYSPANFSDGLKPSPTPGVLIPEDLRALALNNRVFSATTFDPDRDVPEGYELFRRIVPLGPMSLPGHPEFYPEVTTDAGEAVRSSVANVVSGQILPSTGPGITYDARVMWHSDKLSGRAARLTFRFPLPVRASAIAIHSQHSGRDHAATAMRLTVIDGETEREVIAQALAEVDAMVSFPPVTATEWRLELEPGPSRILVIRGIRFLDGDHDFLPRLVPESPP